MERRFTEWFLYAILYDESALVFKKAWTQICNTLSIKSFQPQFIQAYMGHMADKS